MSKLHRDNAGYVGCSYEETQDPFYSYNELSLPLSESDKTVLRDEVTFTVTVAGGKFVIDGTSQATVSLLEGNVYTFDQSDSSNGTHPLKFSYTADGTWGGGLEYTLGVTTNGTPGQSGAYTKIVVPFGLHDLKYYCGNHTGMGGSANVVKNTKAFTFGRPILKTNQYGKGGLVGEPVLLVGDPTSSTDNPFGTGNGHSVDFDGNDALRIAGGSIGTGNWTIEFWVKSASYGLERMVSARQMTYSTERTNLRSYNGQWEFYAGDNPNTQSYSGTNISTNTWVHAAVVRDGTTISYYAAGSRLDTDTIDAAATTTLTEVDVAHGYGSEYFTGQISNVRVSNTARYSGTSYTTPSAGFTSDANTLLLAAHTSNVSTVEGTWSSGSMPGTGAPAKDAYAANLVLALPMNGEDSGTTFADVSATIRGSGSAKSVTRTNAVTKTAVSNFYGSSGYYDANSSRLQVTNSTDFDFGAGDYTIEVWVYPTSSGTRNIVSRSFSGGTNNYSGFILSTAGFLETTNESSWNINISHTLPLNVWSHCAVVRQGNTWTYFVNGVSVGSATAAGSVPTGPGDLYVSYRAGQTDFFGYMQDLRIYKGVAKYTAPLLPNSYGFGVFTYAGDASTTRTFTNKLQFEPDFVWLKCTTTGYHHRLFDRVRGFTTGQVLSSNLDDVSGGELSDANGYVSGTNSSGFSINGSSNGGLNVNASGETYVAFCWKAGGAAVVNTDGTRQSQVSAAPNLGFSIVTYSGNSTAGATVGHGLSSTPQMIWIKNRDREVNWVVGHLPANSFKTGRLYLNSNQGQGTDEDFFNDTNPTDSVFTVKDNYEVNYNGEDYLALCWSEVPGFSKFGHYDGTGDNSNASNTVIDCGFKPAWVMIKSTTTSGEEWMMFDTARNPTNPANLFLKAESSGAASSYQQRRISFVDNGFKFDGANGQEPLNLAGRSYLFAAFGDHIPAPSTFESAVVDELNTADQSSGSNNASNAGATWQTSVKKFYDGAVRFNGSSSSLDISANADLAMGTGDFTYEMYVYQNNFTNRSAFIDNRTTSSTTGITVGTEASNGQIRVYMNASDGTDIAVTGTTMPLNEWVHIAVCRSNGVVTLFVNGFPSGSGTRTSDLNNPTHKTTFGYTSRPGATSYSYLDGYMQDIRIYKGIAKYTSSFSPPERSVQGTARRYPSGVYVVS